MPSLENTSASKPSSTLPLMTWTRGMPALHAATACSALDSSSGAMSFFCMRQHRFQIRHQHLPDEPALHENAVLRRDENQLRRLERLGHRQRHAVGIHAIRLAVAIESERRDDRNHALREQRLEHLHVHPLHLAGEEMIHALDDAERMRDDDVRADRAQVVRRKAFKNFVRQPVRRVQGQLQRRRVRDAGAVEVRGGNLLILPPAP